jgi:hypothetical protein
MWDPAKELGGSSVAGRAADAASSAAAYDEVTVVNKDDISIGRRRMVQGASLGLAAAATGVSLAQAAPGRTSDKKANAVLHDPRQGYPKPPFAAQSQPRPWLASRMHPRPDHGETSHAAMAGWQAARH